MRKRVPLALLALSLVACQGKEKSSLERGAGVYARACASCHGSPGMPGRTVGFAVEPPDLSDEGLQRRLSDADLRRTVTQGKGQMPAFGRMLNDEELSQLVVYLRSLGASREK